MSYQIVYSSGKLRIHRKRRKKAELPIFAVGLLIIVAVPSLLFPKQMQEIRQQMFPWAQPSVRSAFGSFCSDVREGEAFQNAAAAFCREILYGSETAD